MRRLLERLHYKLAMWVQMPGNDFDKPWARWLLNSKLPFTLWINLIEKPIVKLHCRIWGHIVRIDGRGWFCACCLGGSRTELPPAFQRF